MPAKKTHTKNLNQPQKIFCGVLIAAFVVMFGSQVQMAVMQYPSNPNLSGFYISFLTLGLLPAVFFGLAYMLNSRPLSRGNLVFECLLVALAGTMAWTTLNTLLNGVFYATMFPSGDVFGSFGLVSLTAIGLVLVTVGYLLELRRTSHW